MVTNGRALAATMAAAIGSFALGLLVIANEAGVYSAPSLYPKAGGLSGRSTFSVAVWLIAWVILHRAWAGRDLPPSTARWALVLVALALIMTFPPVWGIF